MTSPTDSPEWLSRLTSTKFAEPLGEIALFYLTWRPRLEKAERDARLLMVNSPRHDSTFGSPWALRSKFVAAFLDAHREWTQEDADAAVDLAFAHCTDLTDWMQVLAQAFRIKLDRNSREPQIEIAGWHVLTNTFDPDAMVCFLLAQHRPADALQNLAGWGTATRVGDSELSAILQEGVTDLHVHLGGTRSAQVLWRDLLIGDGSVWRVRRYALKTMDELSAFDAGEHDARVAERDRILELVDVIADKSSPLGQRWNAAEYPVPAPAEGEKRRLDEARFRERATMSQAWRDLIAAKRDPRGDGGSAVMLEHQLDRYLYAKNVFLAHHRQPGQSNPGLGAFRHYYQSVEPIWPEGRLTPMRYERSRRLQIRALAEYAAYIAQSPSLKRVELRMGPLARPRDYHQFFSAWDEVEREFALDKKLEIRFAIHFKRSLAPRSRMDESAAASARGTAAHLHKFLRQIDRDSAMLHAYLSGEEWGRHSSRIARIDFAGSERDIPPDVASFCMNLVRGDREAIGALEAGGCDDELHRFWLLHAERGTARIARGPRCLGVTCHAGEDYAHPLEGIYCIASAARLLKMQEGDTIGHGLALGHDIGSYDRLRSPKSLTVRGLQFDALLWLYCQGIADDPKPLESWLQREVRDIYGLPEPDLPSLRSLEGLIFEHRCRPIADRRRSSAPSDSLSAQLRHLEIWDERCSVARGERVPLDEIVYKLSSTIEAAQKMVLTCLARKGIALEFNPSSNLRVSRAVSLGDIPFTRILKTEGIELLATINTDDPGTFGTRIENEYALVLQSLVEAGWPRDGALATVRRLRDVGRDRVR